MNRYQKLMLGFLLMISLACGSLQIQPGAPSLPTSVPGAVNTYIAQTAEAAFTQTASAAPPTFTPTSTSTSTPTLVVTETPLPTISVHIEQANLDSNSLLIVGQLIGTLAETGYRSVATLSLFDSQKNKLLEQEAPCAETPNEADRLCIFKFSIPELPADFASYQIMGRIQLGNGLTLTGQMESAVAGGETQANVSEGNLTQVPSPSPQPVQPAVFISKNNVSISASFSSSFYYRPENGSFLRATVTYYGDPVLANAANLKFCASIVEHRKYESGKTAQVVLTDECKDAYFSEADKPASLSNNYFFKPSGYSFVLTDSPDGRYQILDVRAVVTLEQNQQVLAASEQSHHPVPVRVVNTSLYSTQATATVEIMAGQGQTYDLALRVYQVEGDPDEVFWSSLLFFIPCIVPGICDDQKMIGESSQPIELTPGEKVTISTSNSIAPVSEEGNVITGYEMVVYFENIMIGRTLPE